MSAMTFLSDDLLRALSLGSLTARHTRNGDPDDTPDARYVHLTQATGSTRLQVCCARGEEFATASARSWPPVPAIADAPTLPAAAVHVFEAAALISHLRPLARVGARVILAVDEEQLALHHADPAVAGAPALVVASNYASTHAAPSLDVQDTSTPAPAELTISAVVLADLAAAAAARTAITLTGAGHPDLLTWTCGNHARGRLRMEAPAC